MVHINRVPSTGMTRTVRTTVYSAGLRAWRQLLTSESDEVRNMFECSKATEAECVSGVIKCVLSKRMQRDLLS